MLNGRAVDIIPMPMLCVKCTANLVLRQDQDDVIAGGCEAGVRYKSTCRYRYAKTYIGCDA